MGDENAQPQETPKNKGNLQKENISSKLLPMLTKLRHAFAGVDAKSAALIDLPRLVVVGSQSSGKSSVLEHIVGRDFLPRGSGIVTRCPLILHLRNANMSPPPAGVKISGDEMVAVFLHQPDKVYRNFDHVRDEINAETSRLVGPETCIADLPIELTVYGTTVLDLSLVDLPGITKVAVGDQPQDIEQIVRDMITRFISNDHTIIIGVTAANQDLANSDALQLARSVDPQGARTISVLTKADLMDEGTSCKHVLDGKLLPLKLGHYAVINRSQKDIDSGKTIKAAIENEKRFFETHKDYKMIMDHCTVGSLTRRLSEVLLKHIQNCLPKIRDAMRALREDTEKLLETLGPIGVSPTRRSIMIANDFCDTLNAILQGSFIDETLRKELYGGARIAYLVHEHFRNCITNMDPMHNITNAEIRAAIYNSCGATPSLLMNTSAFIHIVRNQLQHFKRPIKEVVEQCHFELLTIIENIFRENEELKTVPNLKYVLEQDAAKLLKDRYKETEKLVLMILDAECAYVNTTHPDLRSGSEALGVMEEILRSEAAAAAEGHATTGGQAPPSTTSSHHSSVNGAYPTANGAYPSATGVHPPAGGVKVNPGSSSTEKRETGSVRDGRQQEAPSQTVVPQRRAPSRDAPGAPSPAVPSPRGAPRPPQPTSSKNSKKEQGTYFGNVSRSAKKVAKDGVLQKLDASIALDGDYLLGQRERLEIEAVKLLLQDYFKIVQRTMHDLVPKIVMLNLVNYSIDNIRCTMLDTLMNHPQGVEWLMSESGDTAKKRKRCQEVLAALDEAANSLAASAAELHL